MNTQRLLIQTSAIALSLLSTGCSTIFNRSNQPVQILSNPIGANFEITNRAGKHVASGTTPSSLKLSTSSGFFSGETYSVTFSRKGLPPRTVTLDASISGWYWGNFLVGGLIGFLIIDPISGSMWTLDDTVMADLGTPTSATNERTIQIIERSALPKHLEKHLVAISAK